MGASAVREEKSSRSEKSTGVTVKLYVEICASWGYGGKRDQVLSLIKELNNTGYDVDYVLEPMQGGNGEYYVYIDKGQRTIVFSNNKSHTGAVYGGSINSSNVKNIVTKISSLVGGN